MRDDWNDRKPVDRERRTWREIDQLRGKSERRDRDPMQKQSSPAALAAQKSYRAALERAFASGQLGQLARTLSRPDDNVMLGPETTKHRPEPATTSSVGVVKEPEHVPGNAQTAASPQALPPAPIVPRDAERENRLKLLAKIKTAEGSGPVTRTVDGFLAKYPKLPDDYEVLTKALAHKRDDRVRAFLEQLAEMLAREKPRRNRTLAAQLRFLEDTHGEPDIRRHAAEVRSML